MSLFSQYKRSTGEAKGTLRIDSERKAKDMIDLRLVLAFLKMVYSLFWGIFFITLLGFLFSMQWEEINVVYQLLLCFETFFLILAFFSIRHFSKKCKK